MPPLAACDKWRRLGRRPRLAPVTKTPGTPTAWACLCRLLLAMLNCVAGGGRRLACPGMPGRACCRLLPVILKCVAGGGRRWARPVVLGRAWRRLLPGIHEGVSGGGRCIAQTRRSLSVQSLSVRSLVSIRFRYFRAYRGMLGRACCRLPTAMLKCSVGRRALACVFGHCVRKGA